MYNTKQILKKCIKTKEVVQMKDPLFLILSMLTKILSRITDIFSFIFLNYFPIEKPQDKPDIGFTGFDF